MSIPTALEQFFMLQLQDATGTDVTPKRPIVQIIGGTVVDDPVHNRTVVTLTGGGGGGGAPTGVDVAGVDTSHEYVGQISGFGAVGGIVALLIAGFQFAAGQTAVSISQAAAPLASSVPATFTHTTQAPNAGAILATTRTPGSYIVSLPSPITGGGHPDGNDPGFGVAPGGTPKFWVGHITSANVDAIWLGSGAAAPATSSVALYVDANSNLGLFAPTTTVTNGISFPGVAGAFQVQVSYAYGFQIVGPSNPVLGIRDNDVEFTPSTAGSYLALQIGYYPAHTCNFVALTPTATVAGAALGTNPGSGITVIGYASTVPTAVPGAGYVFLYADPTTHALWVYQPDGTHFQIAASSGGSVTWANDLAGSTGVNQWVSGLSGNGGTTASIPLRSGAFISATANQPIIKQGANLLLATDNSGHAILSGISGVALEAGGVPVGQLEVASGDFISLGATPAASGFVRTSRNAAIVSVPYSGGGADVALLSSGALDQVILGDTTHCAAILGNASGDNLLSLGKTASDFISFGATPGSVGFLRVTGAASIIGRNSVSVLGTTGGGNVVIGDGTVNTGLITLAAGASGGVIMMYLNATILEVASTSIIANRAFNFAGGNANSANAGTNGAPPAQVAGYILCQVNGSAMKVPYYNS